MLISPSTFLKDYKNASYQDLINLKNKITQEIIDFENNYAQKNIDWNISPSPDVRYQWNLKILSEIVQMVGEAFRKERYGEVG